MKINLKELEIVLNEFEPERYGFYEDINFHISKLSGETEYRISTQALGIHLRSFRENHCVKSVRIRSCSGPHFPAFELNRERYGVSLHI